MLAISRSMSVDRLSYCSPDAAMTAASRDRPHRVCDATTNWLSGQMGIELDKIRRLARE
jgi:hypothetical protein